MEKTLSIEQLGRFLGKPVVYEYKSLGDHSWKPCTGMIYLNPHYLECLQDGSVRRIRPVLRYLKDITDAELLEAHAQAQGGIHYPVEIDRIGEDTIYVICKDNYYLRLMAGPHYAGFSMGAYVSDDQPADCEVSRVLDYLDSIGIDTRAYLVDGLAVEKR